MSYLFSPFGCTGRGGWWLLQLLLLIYGFVLGFALFFFISGILGENGLSPAQATQHFNQLSVEQRQELFKRGGEELVRNPFFWLFLLSIPFVVWSSLAIEIKRWHDLGLTGFMELFRFVPTLITIFHVPHAILINWGINLGFLVVFGLIPGDGASPYDEYAAPPPRGYTRPGGYPARGHHPGHPAQTAPPPSSGIGKFVLGFVCALFLIGAVGAAYFLGRGSVPNLSPSNLSSRQPNSSNSFVSDSIPASQPAANTGAPATAAVAPAPTASPAATPPGSDDDNILSREHIEKDNLVVTYAKDWVIVDGQKLSGITSALSAPQYQVSILYADGGKTVPASSLPNGFLSLWSITPQSLEAANQPADTKTNP